MNYKRRPAPRFVASPLVALAPLALAVAVLATGAAIAAKKPGARTSTPAPQVQIDKSKVDLANHRLELRMSLPPAEIEIKVLAESGEVLAEERHDFTGQPAGAQLTVTWNPTSPAPAARIELRAHDVAGGFAGVAIFSWSLSIPHEEVVFQTDSAEIMPSERPKLEQSLQKINAALATHKDEFGRPTLFVAGHTDTVGGDAHNLKLSQARAQSISRWFKSHGLRIPIAYEGFGESALAVKTADNVDEIRNRRVDYILSVEEPALRATGFRPSWKRSN
jgi:outer membrane protein OmpA-like peptidoglycan-associated protein